MFLKYYPLIIFVGYFYFCAFQSIMWLTCLSALRRVRKCIFNKLLLSIYLHCVSKFIK